jgi:hypothetical protein
MATSGQSAGIRKAGIPQHYCPFVAQAEHVAEHLCALGEPEATQRIRSTPVEKATDVTRIFQEAASRHRNQLPYR